MASAWTLWNSYQGVSILATFILLHCQQICLLSLSAIGPWIFFTAAVLYYKDWMAEKVRCICLVLVAAPFDKRSPHQYLFVHTFPWFVWNFVWYSIIMLNVYPLCFHLTWSTNWYSKKEYLQTAFSYIDAPIDIDCGSIFPFYHLQFHYPNSIPHFSYNQTKYCFHLHWEQDWIHMY
jgi:hypothetical protein